MERGIGETFIFKGERYMVCENTANNVSHCWNCAFRHVSCGALELGECSRKYRADNKDVFFYKIVDNKENENMDKKIDLVEILKNCPKGTKLYSPLVGEVEFKSINYDNNKYPIDVSCGVDDVHCFTKEGLFFIDKVDGECMLFPSKDVRSWDGFKVKKPKFDPKTLQPFDRVIAKLDSDDIYYWFADFVSMPATGYDIVPCIISNKEAEMVIPYNEETKHLVGTSDEAPEYYRYWED